MSQIITVTYDGEVLKPSQKLSLNVGKQYQIELLDANKVIENELQLDNLDQEFDWLVADLGVNVPLTRKEVYDI